MVFFEPIRKKTKMAALTSDWLRYFRLLLWNCWTEFSETWQEARPQHPLPSFGKTKWPTRPLNVLRNFRLLWNCWMEFNEFLQEARSQCFFQVCVFRSDRENKMATLASDWLRHFRLLLWNRWTEFNETWHEAICQPPLRSLCFSGR